MEFLVEMMMWWNMTGFYNSPRKSRKLGQTVGALRKAAGMLDTVLRGEHRDAIIMTDLMARAEVAKILGGLSVESVVNLSRRLRAGAASLEKADRTRFSSAAAIGDFVNRFVDEIEKRTGRKHWGDVRELLSGASLPRTLPYDTDALKTFAHRAKKAHHHKAPQ